MRISKILAAALLCASTLGLSACKPEDGKHGGPADNGAPADCAPGDAWFSFKIYTSNEAPVWLDVDGHDQFGRKAVGGKTYPYKIKENTPTQHFICFKPGLIMTAAMKANLVEPVAAEVIGCDVVNMSGEVVPAGAGAAAGDKKVSCRYATGDPGVSPFSKIPK